MDEDVLARAHRLALAYLDGLNERHVGGSDPPRLRRPLTDDGDDSVDVIEQLAADADPGLVASAGPRYFGFVVGGSLPVALAADWLVSAWDQNPGIYATSPVMSVIEDVAREWLLELFDLPRTSSLGFVTGCQMANFTGLATARHGVLRRAGWDVEADG